jgi:holo-[acyl-carrier protein] synthase
MSFSFIFVIIIFGFGANCMVKGIGVDIVEIRRIEACIGKYGDHFLKKVFSGSEISYCKQKKRPAVHFAGRWAAKEAFFKALPPRCQGATSWKSVQILASGGGRPVIDVCSTALGKLLTKASIAQTHLSISHEGSHCVAFVVTE